MNVRTYEETDSTGIVRSFLQNCLKLLRDEKEFVDVGKNPSQQRETLPIPQAPIRLTNVW